MTIILNALFYFGLFLFLYRFIRYITTPFLKKIGYYKYYSPMFFTLPLSFRVLELHIGTTWDFFKLQNANPTLILSHLAEGLVNLAKAVENGQVHPESKLRGYMYYMNPNTVRKFGFNTRKLNFFEIMMFSLNYIELCILQSISYKKLMLVRLENLHILTIRAKDMVKLIPLYEHTYEKFNKRSRIKPLITQDQQTALTEVA